MSKLAKLGGVEVKTFTHLYSQIISLDNLFQAFEEFKKGKRKKIDVGEFERNLEDNIFKLHRELVDKTYKHSSYTGFYITDPKIRHIHKAAVRDRIVHHAIFKILNPIFEKTFISDSFSCRKGYGTHKGFKKLVSYSRKVSRNYTQDCWALKCDIRKFFDTIDHETLLKLVKRKVADPDTLWLLEEIIRGFEIEKGKGIPIGNLTSQLFANVYLDELDQYVKHKLKVKYYLRYADDFVLLSENREELERQKASIGQFLSQSLKLDLHPNKVYLRKLSCGIDFVGYVALPYYQVVRTKTKKRILKKVEIRSKKYKLGVLEKENLNQSVQSYFGVLKHVQSYKIERQLKNVLSNIMVL